MYNIISSRYKIFPKNEINHATAQLNTLREQPKIRPGSVKSDLRAKNIIINRENEHSPISTRFINESNYYKKLFEEEKVKNKKLKNNILLLNKRIDELEYELSIKSKSESPTLQKENEELKLFKQKVYLFSMKYDELNENILESLKEIDNIIESLEKSNIKISFSIKLNELSKTADSFKSIVTQMSNFMTCKQEEYNVLLKQKELEISEIKKENELLNNKIRLFFKKYSDNFPNFQAVEFSPENQLKSSHEFSNLSPSWDMEIKNEQNKISKLEKLKTSINRILYS